MNYNTRYYNTPPESMTLEMCAYHGGAHKAYGWNQGIDPRWNEEQKKAYQEAYDQTEFNPD